MRLTFRRRPTALERLRDVSWRCASCDEEHRGMFDLGAWSPAFWEGPEDLEPNAALRTDGDFLSEDFCVIGGTDFFVRGVLAIPVHGLDTPLGFGVWSTLSRRNFDIYVEGFDRSDYADWGPWTGWFSTALPDFGDTLQQPAWVEPRPDRLRPLIWLDDDEHPLSVAQRDGTTPERVLEIYAAYGHAPKG